MIGVIVYIDVLFAVNFFINYALICATQYAARIRTRKFGKEISAFLGALYACFMFFPSVAPLFCAAAKIISALVLVAVSFKAQKIAVYIRAVLTFYLVSFVFCGVMIGVLYFAPISFTSGTAYSNGIFYFGIPLEILVFSTLVSYAVISFVFKHYNANKKTSFCNVEVFEGDKSVVLKCLADSGNLLKDPITGSPVIVARYLSVKKILPDDVCSFFETECFKNNGGDLKNKTASFCENALLTNGTATKIRAIPFSSLGAKKSIIWGFKPDYATVCGTKKDDIVIGIYEGSLSEKNDYDAVAGPGAY